MEIVAFSGFSITALAGILALTWRALSAERQRGEQKARADALDVNLTGLAAQLSDVTLRLKTEQERTSALDALLAEAAVSGPVVGSWERLLQKWQTARAPSGDGLGVVHQPTGTDDPDGLMPLE